MTIQCFQRALRRGNVKGDFRRVHFECELDAVVSIDVQNRLPGLCKFFISIGNLSRRAGREGVEQVPDR
jgi:hypothetical protein